MATCEDCNREMTTAEGCDIDGGRVRWGDETHLMNRVQFAWQRNGGDLDEAMKNPVPEDDPEYDKFMELCNLGKHFDGRRCPDCSAKPGGLHHAGCDTEECPDCHRQAISCECDGWLAAIARGIAENANAQLRRN